MGDPFRREPGARFALTWLPSVCQDATGSGVVVSGVAGLGRGLSEVPVWGCEPAALESESLPSRGCRHVSCCVVDHGPVHDVGQPSFEQPHRLVGGISAGSGAVEVGAALGGVAQLDDGRDAQHLVDLTVAAWG